MDLGFTLAKDETVLRKVNRHWIVLMPVVASSLASIFIAIGITYLFGRYRSDFPSTMTGSGLFVFDIVMLIFAIILLYAGYWVYRRNFLVLTNQHLVRVEQKGLFAHTVSQLALARVQDVSGSVPGFLATVLGYGNLTVETAGAEDNFVFNNIYAPADVASVCLKAHEAYTPSIEAQEQAAAPVSSTEMPIPTPVTPPTLVAEPVTVAAAPPVVEPVAEATPEIPEPLAEPTMAPVSTEPSGPIPLAQSVTTSIEHHED